MEYGIHYDPESFMIQVLCVFVIGFVPIIRYSKKDLLIKSNEGSSRKDNPTKKLHE